MSHHLNTPFWKKPVSRSVFAGILLGLGYPPFPFPILVIPAFMLIYGLIWESDGFRSAAKITYPAFLVWNITGTYWLMMATVAGGVAAIVANAAIMSLLAGGMCILLKRNKSIYYGIFGSAALWTAYEWLHLKWDLAWPWLAVANAWSSASWAVQYIELTGYLSISFIMLSVAGLLQYGYSRAKAGEKIIRDLIHQKATRQAVVIFFSSILLSISIYFIRDFKPVDTAFVVVAQPNFDSYLHLAGYPDSTTPLLELTAMLDSVVTQNTDFVFWPENALMSRTDRRRRSFNDNHIHHKAAEWNAPVITGAAYYAYYTDREPPRVHLVDGTGTAFNFFNSAVGFYPDGSRKVYKKIRLVPIVERVPFVTALSYLPLPINWGNIAGYGKGTEMIVFDDVDGKFSAPAIVCYDSVFPAVVRRSVAKGADFIAVITNDGWWGNTSGHIQHYEFARLRAIEMRRAVVRSANNGISGMITADGRAHTRTEYWTRTAFELEVPVHNIKTLYTRLGDWFPLLLTFFSIFCFFRKEPKES
ncbi:MAG: apolipoprotein N-acyltransferase [Balneolales bacterium]|nr:apolipoprotein N-acyltransferase [Balneolales bacterium]